MQSPRSSAPAGGNTKAPKRRLSLCNDLVFKVLFATHLPLLTDLINAVLYPAPPITVRGILNPHILPAELTSKSVVLDILAEDTQGQRLGVEMQLRRYLHWPQRNIYGVARTLASQLQAGQDYQQLKPAIGISLLAHDLFDKHPDQACWRFTLRDQKRPWVHLGSVLQVHIIELRKAERLRKLPAPLRAWIACLLHNLNEAAMNAITYPPVKQALAYLETMCSDEELRLIAERRAQALVDDRDALGYARHEGERIGLKKGKRIGLKQGMRQGMQQQRQTLLRMLERKFGPLDISCQARLAGASMEQLHAWSLNLLDAQRVDDVFV
jgi:predicted transposase/invertase (TIGR01784 family)